MGTRSLTHVKSEDKDSETLTTIYRQMDGYPTGMGQEIKDSLSSKTVVNGYSDPSTQVNGMGCAAAMLIRDVKDGCGGIYIYRPDSDDCWEDYTYTLWADGDKIHIECRSGETPIYSGPLADFDTEKAENDDD